MQPIHFCTTKKTNMNKLLSLLLLCFANVSFAQKAGSVITNGGVDDVYYSFSTDEVKRINRANWDIGFILKGFDASILINENAGVSLYVYGSDTSAWNSVDTANFGWSGLHNSEESWSLGAFANHGGGHPDYGWGTYTMTNHDINGDKIFIIKLSNGNYKQIMIAKMSASGVYTVKVGDIGGNNSYYFQLDKKETAYAGKNFVFYNLANNTVVNEEPAAASWDLLFTKYTSLIPVGQQFQPYLVSGVKINAGYEVAERTGFPTSSNDTSTLLWNKNVTEIGSDWKTFNNSTFLYDIEPDVTYFVRTSSGDVWKIYFTDYKGGSEGGFYFNTQKMTGSASVNKLITLQSNIYPNPAKSEVQLVNNETSEVTATVIDMQGRVLTSAKLNALETVSLSTSSFARGVYTVIFANEYSTASKKLILE